MSTILLIEDDVTFRSMLCTVLTQLGHDVTEAADGEEGIGLFGAGRHDVVITDLLMPNKEGIETIMEMRKLDRAVKVIAMSGGGRMAALDYLQIARQVGAKKILAKPFRYEDLRAVIAEVLAPAEPLAQGAAD